MANPFRNKTMRALYDDVIAAHASGSKTLFLSNGERRRVGCYGSSIATSFWRGYDGVIPGGRAWDRHSRDTIAYALWCAGRDVAKAEGKR